MNMLWSGRKNGGVIFLLFFFILLGGGASRVDSGNGGLEHVRDLGL